MNSTLDTKKKTKISYYKKIKITDIGMVTSEIFRNDSKRVALKFFNLSILKSIFGYYGKDIAKLADKAHKWADDYIIAIDSRECL